jgi:hypothetical protein
MYTSIVIYQPLPRMEFIFLYSYATLDQAVCIQTFFLQRHLILSIKLLKKTMAFTILEFSNLIFRNFSLEYISTLFESMVSIAYR